MRSTKSLKRTKGRLRLRLRQPWFASHRYRAKRKPSHDAYPSRSAHSYVYQNPVLIGSTRGLRSPHSKHIRWFLWGTQKFIQYFSIFLYNQKNYKEKSLIEMVLAVPKAFILNSLLDSKLSDSHFIINPFIMYVISINVKKYQKIPKML